MHRSAICTVALLVTLVLLAGCAGDGDRVRVLAASSLTDVMPHLVDEFERQRPDISLTVAYAGSQALATQIEEGAPADVFISANVEQGERLTAQGLGTDLRPVARNELVIAVARNSDLDAIDDLAAEDITVALGVASVPVGALTAQVLAELPTALRDGIMANVITEDPNVRAVLNRVETGEADAGFVYRTDLRAAPDLRAISIDGSPSNTYVAVAVDGDPPSSAASAFLDFLTSPGAAAILIGTGIEPLIAPVEATP